MSIPTPFNQLGTLGAGDYIQDGLLLLFDAKREPAGTLNSLTNFATGEAVALANNVENEDSCIINKKNRLNVSLGTVMNNAKAFEFVCGYAYNAGFIGVSAFNNSLQIYYFPEVQELQPTADWLRVNKRRSLSKIIGTARVWGIYFTESETEVYNGELKTTSATSGAAVFGDFTLGKNIPFFSMRIYSRELTSAEKFHNWSVDKRKFGL